MQMPFGVLLVSGICGGLLGALQALPVTSVHRLQLKQVDQRAREVYHVVDVANEHPATNNRLDIVSKIQRSIILAQPEYNMITGPKVKGTAYVMVKSTRRRDKRYISYVAFCHFKICRMVGGKRTARFVHVTGKSEESVP